MDRAALVSIIVPVYNAESYLQKALGSLERQTYTNIEIIMVNDGSTDRSEAICRSFCDRDKRFLYVYQQNAGVSAARNTGLKHATGQYITFMDSDDWVEDDYVETLYTLLKGQNGDISIILPFEKNSRIQEKVPIAYSKDDAIIELYKGEVFEKGIWAKLFKKTLFSGVYFPENIAIAEDIITAARLICNAEKIVFQNTKKYHYVLNPVSATKMRWNPKTWSCMEAAKELYTIIAAHFPEKAAYGAMLACDTNLVIAKKLVGCGKLDKTNYLRVKEEIAKYYSGDAEKVMSQRLRKELGIFFKSRILYIFCRKIFKSKLMLKIRGK